MTRFGEFFGRFGGAAVLPVQVFLYLQVLDFLTTLIGFRLGASEASPFIAHVIQLAGPAAGVGLMKLTGVGIGYLCIATNRARLIRWINYWYAGLVIWNLGIIMLAAERVRVTQG